MPKATASSLKVWRLREGLSQSDAAEILGISQGYYAKLERRKQVPRLVILRRIVDRTGVSVAGLVGLAS